MSPPDGCSGPLIVHVTGGSGFLGAHLVPLLVARGHLVIALARSATAADRLRSLGARPVAGNLDDQTSVEAAFSVDEPTVLVNLASLGFGHATTIVRAAENRGLRRAIFVSTTSIYTRLDAPSKVIRRAAEESIRSSNLDWTILRPTMIYGTPGDRNMWRLLTALRRSPVIPLPGGGRRLQQPVHVADVAAAVVQALDRDVAIGRDYNLAGPDALTFRQVIEQASSALGRRPRTIPIPLAPSIAALRAYERVVRRPALRAEQLERLAEDKAFDISPAKRDLGYAPRAFAVGIAEEAAMLR